MSSRYYLADLSPEQTTATLEGAEAHHLLHVMRARDGDAITLFDGRGREYAARVVGRRRKEAALEIDSHQEVDRELRRRLRLAVAIPKGERQRWLVEKAVELGVASLTPLSTRRSVAAASPNSLERLRRSVIEASKQCGRTRLMTLHEPEAWESLAARPAESQWRLLADPAAASSLEQIVAELAAKDEPPGQEILVAIGPEGGLDEQELQQGADAGWLPFHLGPLVLRVETAALAAAAKLAR